MPISGVSTDAEVGRRVRAARAYAGLRSVEALADAVNEAGLGVRVLQEIERGKRHATRPELIVIAEACGVAYEFFTVDFSTLGATNRHAHELEAELKRLERLRQEDLAQIGEEVARQVSQALASGALPSDEAGGTKGRRREGA